MPAEQSLIRFRVRMPARKAIENSKGYRYLGRLAMKRRGKRLRPKGPTSAILVYKPVNYRFAFVALLPPPKKAQLCKSNKSAAYVPCQSGLSFPKSPKLVLFSPARYPIGP